MALKDIAVRGVETAGLDATAAMLARTMAEKGVGSVVITEENRVVGIVTDRDLALTMADEADPTALTAEEVMTPEPRTMHADAGILELTSAMSREEVRRMPIVDANGIIVGIVTLDDVVRLLATELYDVAGVIEAESP